MIRQIIKINKKKCNGCGICVAVCHERDLDMVDNKAKLVREDFCDGFGTCVSKCPREAISWEKREALEYDMVSAKWARLMLEDETASSDDACDEAEIISLDSNDVEKLEIKQWPCQIKFAPTRSDAYNGSNLLIAAACTAYAYRNIHDDFMKGRLTLIACPKVVDEDYSKKILDIIRDNEISSILVLKMEIGCCGDIVKPIRSALKRSDKKILCEVVTISRDGSIL